ncbi:MAG: hypothetical protein ACO29C_04245, partial [Fluviibacter sp.]
MAELPVKAAYNISCREPDTEELSPMSTQPSKSLETFPNPTPQRDFTIHMEIPEFTCLCPKTGQP